MTDCVIVTGTDTEIGKTVFAAGLTKALGATYWKPVQAGLADETDTETVSRLSGAKTIPEAYRLKIPASPHLAAENEAIEIEEENLIVPERVGGSLVIEGAGGLMVPLNRKSTYLDIFARWEQPIILCARTKLGTINHSLLSIEAIRARSCCLIGVAFIGDAEPDVEQTICEFGKVRHLGRLPFLSSLTPAALHETFENEIDVAHIEKAMSA